MALAVVGARFTFTGGSVSDSVSTPHPADVMTGTAVRKIARSRGLFFNGTLLLSELNLAKSLQRGASIEA
jgi:hypothetical protein